MKSPLLVIGAGPAGLSAAATAAEAGFDVTLAEYHTSPARKLLASGAGKCNLTNTLDARAFAARFLTGERFVRYALGEFPPDAFRAFLAAHGVPTVAPDGFHVFPKSMRAGDILDLYLKLCRRFGVKIATGTPVTRADPAKQPVILATGGLGYPALGGKGSGYEIARKLGHTVTTPVPALVGLQCKEPWAKSIPGIILPDAQTRFGKKLCAEGELIFTHTGISGPAVLDLAGVVARELLVSPEVTLFCNFFASSPAEEKALLLQARQENGRKSLRKYLATRAPAAFAQALGARLGIPAERILAELKSGEQEQLITALTCYPMKITGTDGWNKAMATNGGIPLSEVNPKTLESRIVPGLFFAGEILDVGARCGGYNIQWAVSSGRFCAMNIKSM